MSEPTSGTWPRTGLLILPRNGGAFPTAATEPNTRERSAVERFMSLTYIDWDIGDVTVISLAGRITLGEGTSRLRTAVRDAIARGRTKILLNMYDVFFIDSSGLGELVIAHVSARKSGTQVKLMKINQMTRDLLQITKLYSVFEVFPDEPSALQSFQTPA